MCKAVDNSNIFKQLSTYTELCEVDIVKFDARRTIEKQASEEMFIYLL